MIALAVAGLFVGKYPLSMQKLLAGNEMQWRVFLTLRLSLNHISVFHSDCYNRILTHIFLSFISKFVAIMNILARNKKHTKYIQNNYKLF